jgi:methylated-DNA-[protein]-cysteine S-methyltransferase
MKNVWYYDSPVGTLGIAEDGVGITDIFRADGAKPDGLSEAETSMIKMAAQQLKEYFEGRRRDFELPLSLNGTSFQRSVWKALQAIPYGETRSYRQIAEQAGSPKACRAVGMANHRNPVMIVVPCHRVIGADGSMVGYGGGLEMKEFLLRLEGKNRKK